jgi:hypothetical protein
MQRLAHCWTDSLLTRSLRKLQPDRQLEQSERVVMKEGKVKAAKVWDSQVPHGC